MTRFSSLLLSLILALSLVLGAGVGGYLRSAHALAAAGQVSLVICGEGGAKTVTLDRDGNAVDPQGGACAHCSACLGTADFMLPVLARLDAPIVARRDVEPVTARLSPSQDRRASPSRDPPAGKA